jgi:hypothetical protein
MLDRGFNTSVLENKGENIAENLPCVGVPNTTGVHILINTRDKKFVKITANAYRRNI